MNELSSQRKVEALILVSGCADGVVPKAYITKSMLSLLIATFFLVSGSFKLIQLTRQLGLAGFLPSVIEYGMVIVSVCEIAYAGLLWHSPRSKSLNSLGLLVMLLLSIYESKMVFSGVKSCGCFGEWETRPLFVLVLDIAIIGLLLFLRPACSFEPTAFRANGIAASTIVATILACDGFFFCLNEDF